MNKEAQQKDIKNFMKSLGTDVVGFCSAKPFDVLKEVYLKKEAMNLSCEFEKRENVADLVDPKRTYLEGKSFIVMLETYQRYTYASNEKFKGKMASGTATVDYHTLIHEKLNKLKAYLQKNYGIEGKIIVDTSALSDRAIAVRAGLGDIRRNSMFYHSKLGSQVYIGALMINQDISTGDYEGRVNPCGSCKICVTACPGQAILSDASILDSQKCVAYLTQKKELTREEGAAIGDMIYGCDVCQRVCPENKDISYPSEEYKVEDLTDLKELLEMSNKDFAHTFKQTAAGWRGKRTLQRNALACLGNSQNPEAIKLIQPYLEDVRPIIRKEALYAMERLKKSMKE